VKLLVKLLQNQKAHKELLSSWLWAFCCCRGRDRTSTRQLAIAQSLSTVRQISVVDPGRLLRDGSTLRLSCYPHPRDKRACLPKFHHPTVVKNWCKF